MPEGVFSGGNGVLCEATDALVMLDSDIGVC